MQNSLSRTWFLSQGCKLVPLEYTRGVIRWAHPDGYFLNAQGQKVVHSGMNPSNVARRNMHGRYPQDRTTQVNCHILMALAFYGTRPDSNSEAVLQCNDPTGKNREALIVPLGKEAGHTAQRSGSRTAYVCHHLIPDKLDYRPANLLCWLTREQHTEADRRQRALRKVVPDLHEIGYDRLRQIQDPRVTSTEEFAKSLANLIIENNGNPA